jgi:hypothetical protein
MRLAIRDCVPSNVSLEQHLRPPRLLPSRVCAPHVHDAPTRNALINLVGPGRHFGSRQRLCKRRRDIRVISIHNARNVLMGELHLQLRPGLKRRLTGFQLEVKQVEVLGNISSGSTQLLGPITAGQLASEPGFEPQFNGSVKYAGDYLTQDPSDGVARPACVGAIYPDNGDTPFLFRISGIDHASAKAVEIFTSDEDLNLSIPYGYSYSGLSMRLNLSPSDG